MSDPLEPGSTVESADGTRVVVCLEGVFGCYIRTLDGLHHHMGLVHDRAEAQAFLSGEMTEAMKAQEARLERERLWEQAAAKAAAEAQARQRDEIASCKAAAVERLRARWAKAAQNRRATRFKPYPRIPPDKATPGIPCDIKATVPIPPEDDPPLDPPAATPRLDPALRALPNGPWAETLIELGYPDEAREALMADMTAEDLKHMSPAAAAFIQHAQAAYAHLPEDQRRLPREL